MILQRHSDANIINRIVNHPEVYPWVKGSNVGPLDLANTIADKRNIALVADTGVGCIIFHYLMEGFYEFHTCITPEGRGLIIDGASQAFNYMFTQTPAIELMTKCPKGNDKSVMGAKLAGCSYLYTGIPNFMMNGKLVTCDIYSIMLQTWANRASGMVERGREFHDRLDGEYSRIGHPPVTHEDDELHNRYVGIAVEMILGGQVLKAISFYNRWAVMCGYKIISVLSIDPIIIDIGEAKIKISGDNLEVINQCQQAA